MTSTRRHLRLSRVESDDTTCFTQCGQEFLARSSDTYSDHMFKDSDAGILASDRPAMFNSINREAAFNTIATLVLPIIASLAQARFECGKA